MCCWVHELLYCVGWFLEYLCVCFCNKVISGGNCHFGGWCVDCVESMFEFEDLYDLGICDPRCIPKKVGPF